MERRTFFKVLAAFSGAVAVPALGRTLIREATLPIAKNEVCVGLIRELAQYDLSRDYWAVRWDILTNSVQLHVDMRFNSDADAKKLLPESRITVKELFENELKHRGLSWADLKPLPIPSGYEPPNWLANA